MKEQLADLTVFMILKNTQSTLEEREACFIVFLDIKKEHLLWL